MPSLINILNLQSVTVGKIDKGECGGCIFYKIVVQMETGPEK